MTDDLIARLRAEERRQRNLFDWVVATRDAPEAENGSIFAVMNQAKHAIAGRDPCLEPAADHIAALETERDALRAELDAIRKELGSHVLVPPDGGAELTVDVVSALRAEIEVLREEAGEAARQQALAASYQNEAKTMTVPMPQAVGVEQDPYGDGWRVLLIYETKDQARDVADTVAKVMFVND